MKTKLLSYSVSGLLSARFSGIRKTWKRLVVLAAIWAGVCGFGIIRLYASCIVLDDVPLDTLQQQGAGILMFLIDDSGSMDWEVICKGSNNGLFVGANGSYGYIFANPGDNLTNTGYNTPLEGSADANKWQSRWCGYNRMYYDPSADYTPWPTCSDVDPDTPRSNPTSSTYTLDLSVVYSFIPFKILDNSDSDFSKTPSTGTSWSSSTSGTDKYGTNYLYTTTVGDTATWTFNNVTAGIYDVAAWWHVNTTNNSTSVKYIVNDEDAATVDQTKNGGKWNIIASNKNFPSNAGTVKFTVPSGNTKRYTADAMCLGAAIHRSHYYIQNATGKYLVDMDSGASTIRYYRYSETDNDNTVESGELTPLTLAQATTAGIVTGRTYAQERQNFANWYSYYRRRILTAKSAVSNVIYSMNGVFIGLISINNNNSVYQYALPVHVRLDNETFDQTSDLLAKVFKLKATGSTPLRTGLNDMGQYFKGAYNKPSTLPSYTKKDGTIISPYSASTYPFFIEDKGGGCQQAFTIMMTDGFWNDDGVGNHDPKPPSVGNADANDPGNPFDGPPFEDGYSDTLADYAMYYYKNDLNTTLGNHVPISAKDPATHQHMVTYGLSFGLDGTIVQANYPNCPQGSCPVWPNVIADGPTTIDDLWHATVNGRGKYISASSPTEMVDAMNTLKHEIESRLGSAASLATSSIQQQVGTMIYQGTYYTGDWSGDVKALPVDVQTGAMGDPIWRASEHVPAWASRNILSYNGVSGIVFAFGNISGTQATLLSNRGDNVNDLINFIRGDASKNVAHGGNFRTRGQSIGDFIHSAPTYYNGVIYIGSNDGMLHAIDATNGNEIFCYVPGLAYDHLSDLADPGYSHRYYVDGTPAVAKVGSQDILVCGLGKGGKGYFGLDVTHPDAMAAGNVLWEYPSGTDGDLGYAFSQATIVTTKAAGRTVIFGNGYDSATQKAVLYLVNPVTGALIKKLDTPTTECNGLSTPRAADVEGDGYADYAFAGDLLGNMWKFDLRGESINDWKVYYQSGSLPSPLISVRNNNGDVQAITTAPEIMLDCANSDFAKSGAGLMVIFGTGRYLNSTDLGSTSKQSFYGIWDWGNIWEKKSGYDVAKTKNLGTLGSGRSLSNVSGKSLLEQTVASRSGDWVTLSGNTVDWFNPDDTTVHMGWVFDLPGAGERGIREPMLRMGVAVMISTIPSSSPCQAGGSSVLYQVKACTGGRTDKPQFDVNGDEIIDAMDLIGSVPPTGKEFDQMLFEAIEIGNTLYLPNSQANVSPLDVPPNLVGMQFWRVVQ